MTSKLKIEIPRAVNPDLQEEREKATFNVQKLVQKLHGGLEKWRKKKEIGEFISCRDKALNTRSGICTPGGQIGFEGGGGTGGPTRVRVSVPWTNPVSRKSHFEQTSC